MSRNLPPPRELSAAEKAVDEACWLFMTHEDLAILRRWWEAETMRAVMPPGPVDTTRLLMSQGDRERMLTVMTRAARHQQTVKAL